MMFFAVCLHQQNSNTGKMVLRRRQSNAFFRRLLVLWVVMTGMWSTLGHCKKCEFKAIFNFGDSNSDTGGFWAAFPAQSGPFGVTYFNRPAGRASDGRLIVDFLAQALGLPFLSPSIPAINGIRFQTWGQLCNIGIYGSPAKHILICNRDQPFFSCNSAEPNEAIQGQSSRIPSNQQKRSGSTKLPSRGIFGKSLYTFYIGQNDFTSNLGAIGIGGVKQYLPQVVNQMAGTIKELYVLGGRAFLVLNLAPVGCYPAFIVGLPHNRSDIDVFGCLISYNKAVEDYNRLLNQTLSRTRSELPKDASLIYVDIHSVLLELFQHPTVHGLKYGTKACCGQGGGVYNFNPEVYCGNSKVVNGRKLTALACNDPYNYVSWDGIHATEVVNKILTLAILNGSYFDPPFPLHLRCDLQPIG